MKKKSIITMVAALALVGAIGVGSTLAYFTDSDAASNVVTMGHVDITLTETSGDEEVVITDEGLAFDHIVPGDVLSKEPVITVADDSENCYLRAKVVIDGLDEINGDYADELLANIDINGKQWKLGDDGYFYYQSEVTAEDVVTLFTTVTIPTAWGNEAADEEFTIAITAEAIQADNFTPATAEDEKTITGWGDVTVKTYNAPAVTTPDAE